MDGIFFTLATVACLIGVIVGIPVGLITHDWSCEGCSWAMFLPCMMLGSAMTGPRRPMPYCRRCGYHHPRPLGPNCPR
jgi:hypothetical protein